MSLPKKSWRSIRSSASRYGIQINPPHPGAGRPLYDVAGRTATVRVLYHNGGSVTQHLAGGDIALVQCGASGEWLAVLPAGELFKLIHDSQLAESGSEDVEEYVPIDRG